MLDDYCIIPGLFDMHVHFRQPGFEHKEDIRTGSEAAFAGGVTMVQVMPNTNPVLDDPSRIQFQIEEAKRLDGVHVIPSGAITKGLQGKELTDFRALKNAGVLGITDDGMPVMSDDLMKEAMILAKENDLVVMQHAEDHKLSRKSSMSEGAVSKRIGIVGQDPDAEAVMVERDIRMVEDVRTRYHVLHISTRRALDAVKRAKDKGLPVTCEVTPHHLFLTEDACEGQDPNTKMNPPLRTRDDKQAVLDGLRDGTIDAVASDHAPHSAEEKGCGFCDAPFGVVGLETAFSSLMTLVDRGWISLERAVELMTVGPMKVLGLPIIPSPVFPEKAAIHASRDPFAYGISGALINLNRRWRVSPSDLKGKSHNSAFLGHEFVGKVVGTWMNKSWKYWDEDEKTIDQAWISENFGRIRKINPC